METHKYSKSKASEIFRNEPKKDKGCSLVGKLREKLFGVGRKESPLVPVPKTLSYLVKDHGINPCGKVMALLASNECVYFYS